MFNFSLQRFSKINTVNEGSVLSVNSNAVLSTVPSAQNGALWFELKNNVPYLVLKYGDYEYSYSYNIANYVGDADDAISSFLDFEGNLTDTGGAVWTAVGDVSFDSDIKKFGTMSLHTPPSAYIETNNLFDINSNKWTLDFWCYLPDGTSGRIFSLAQKSPPGQSGLALYADGFWFANNTGTGWGDGIKITFLQAAWNHVAIVKNELTWLFFLNGVLKGRSINTTGPYTGPNFRLGGTLYISGSGDPAVTDLYIDNFRLYDNIARWSEDFIVPDASDY